MQAAAALSKHTEDMQPLDADVLAFLEVCSIVEGLNRTFHRVAAS